MFDTKLDGAVELRVEDLGGWRVDGVIGQDVLLDGLPAVERPCQLTVIFS